VSIAEYEYLITATANDLVASDSLKQEIEKEAGITIQVNAVSYDATKIYIEFADALPGTQKADYLDDIVADHEGVPLDDGPELITFENLDDEGKILVGSDKPSGEEFKAIVSHDYTDKCTWYQESTEVTGETLSLDTGTTYESDNTHWIDLTHGRHTREDDVSDDYLPVIYDNGVEQTSGITIDYENGKVTFDSAPTGPVTADYHYSDGSTWTLKPESGQKVQIEHAELDFTTDIGMKETTFEIWAYDPADLPNKMMVEKVTYKNMKDILKVGNDVHVVPNLTQIGEEVLRVVFDYGRMIDLKDSLGLELRIKTKDDEAMTGTFGTITLYTIPKDE
jgi:hypothetical protein